MFTNAKKFRAMLADMLHPYANCSGHVKRPYRPRKKRPPDCSKCEHLIQFVSDESYDTEASKPQGRPGCAAQGFKDTASCFGTKFCEDLFREGYSHHDKFWDRYNASKNESDEGTDFW